MKKKIAAVLLAVGMLFTSVAVAAPAQAAAPTAVVAGNGTNNYYLKGSCTAKYIDWPGGIYLNVTTWDNGPNAYYHVSRSRSGVAYAYGSLYIDGYKKSGFDGDEIYWAGGHGKHSVKVTGTLWGNPISCTVTI